MIFISVFFFFFGDAIAMGTWCDMFLLLVALSFSIEKKKEAVAVDYILSIYIYISVFHISIIA